MLKRNTALEGLYSAFLTIKQGDKVIRYEGIHIRRLPVTSHEYVFLPIGSTVVSPVIAVSKAYKFPRDGLYTIEYTGTIHILSPDSMHDEDQTSINTKFGVQCFGTILASVQVLVKHSNNIEMLQRDEESVSVAAQLSMTEKEFDETATAYSTKCKAPWFIGGTKEQQQQTTLVHQSLCYTYPMIINAIETNHIKFKKWFGTATNKRVVSVYSTILRGLSRDKVVYSYKGSHCVPNGLAYTMYGTRTVYICPAYHEMELYCNPPYTAMEDSLVHEWTHAYSNTIDFVYGVEASQKLAKMFPNQAINNADNYAYFYCDTEQ